MTAAGGIVCPVSPSAKGVTTLSRIRPDLVTVAAVNDLARTARAYAASSVRIARRGRLRPLGREERLVFVVGSLRSGTTFTGGAIGSSRDSSTSTR